MSDKQQIRTENGPALYGKASRAHLAQLAMQLLDRWELSNQDKLELLGIPQCTTSILARYRRGQPLPAHRDALERVGHLLAIHKGLRLYFPHNPDIAYGWISTRNQDLGGISPVDLIRRDGFSGLLAVRDYVESMLSN